MRDVYGDDYDSLAGTADPLVPASVQRIAGAVVFLGLVAAMGTWSYRLGTRDANEVPIIRAIEGPARIEPKEPGGLVAEHQGLEVNKVMGGESVPAPAPAKVVPTPEVLTAEDEPGGELIIKEQARIDAEAAAALESEEQLEVTAPSEDPAPGAVAPNLQSELTAMVNAVVPEEVVPPEPAAEALPAPEEPVSELAAVPSSRPMGRPANLAVVRGTAAETPPQRSAAATASKPVGKEVTSMPQGSRLVQLGAYDSEEIARSTWNRLVARQGDLLGGKSLFIERATSNARVFYRLRVAGFQDTEQTRAMCEALKARGVDCIPVTLQ